MTILIKNKTNAQQIKDSLGALVSLFFILCFLGIATWCVRKPLLKVIQYSRGIRYVPELTPMTYLEILTYSKNEQAARINNLILDLLFENIATQFPSIPVDTLVYLFYKNTV